MEPIKIRIKTYIDDRGFIHQIYEFDKGISFDGVNYLKDIPSIKRTYLVGNFSKNVIRGMHFHKYEWKYFFVIKGSVKFVLSKNKEPDEAIKIFVLSDKSPEVLVVPPGYYNGWIALEEGTILMGMSNFTLQESINDDFRVSPESFKEYFKVKDR